MSRLESRVRDFCDDGPTQPITLDDEQMRQLAEDGRRAEARFEEERRARAARLEELMDAVEAGGEVALHAIREIVLAHTESYLERTEVTAAAKARLVKATCRHAHRAPSRHTTARSAR